MTSPTVHIPVMRDEVVGAIGAQQGGVFLDCTFGGGGHSGAILAAHPENQVVACDRDGRAVERGRQSLECYGSRLELHHAPFSDLARRFAGRAFHGVIADLGISTDQLKENRGFSFHDSGIADMRMDEGDGESAQDLLNRLDEREIMVMLRKGGAGEEARAVARSIVGAHPIVSVEQLQKIVTSSVRSHERGKKRHPATVIFQAIRMAVNGELEQIDALMQAVPGLARRPGTFAAITFHSLEDKAVTRVMRQWQGGDDLPALWPGQRERLLGMGKLGELVTPSDEEIERNPSARSARLRIFAFN